MRHLDRYVRGASQWMRQHGRLVRNIKWALGAIFVLIIFAQLLYPAGRILPFVEVQDRSMGGATAVNAAKRLEADYKTAKLTLKTEDKSFTKSFDEIGIDIESTATARAAARYTLGQRLIPFSSLGIMLTRDTPTQVRFDDDRLEYFAQESSKEGYVAASNATVTVKGSKVELVPAKPSKEYSMQAIMKAIKDANFAPKTEVVVQPKIKEADRTDDEVKGVLSNAQRAMDTPLNLKLGDEKITVEKTTVGSWLDFYENPETKKLELGLKPGVVREYLNKIQSKIYKAPGTTKVQLIDGREVSRTAGEPGRGIDMDKTIKLFDEVVRDGKEQTVNVPIAQLAPKVVYERQYSNSDAGLAALLSEIGGGYGISVMEIGGRSANINGNKQFVAASTYKLFVAYAVFKEIEAGRMSWTDTISGGRSAEVCFDVMIVKSDNPCAKAFGDRIGWQNVENQMRGLGLGSTELSPSLYTTANDLALFLYKLENGTLLSGADRGRLIDAMKRQVYRSGLPAGTGAAVANKVGFIDSYIHDPGIVYGPHGPYVLVIMTSGSSWGGIADAARQIHNFLNR